MASQLGLQKNAIHLLPNTSKSKDKQKMKLDQLREYNKKIFFFKNYAKNEKGRLVPDLFLFFQKA